VLGAPIDKRFREGVAVLSRVGKVGLGTVSAYELTAQVRSRPPDALPNGSDCDRPLPQILEPQQHGQHPFQLAVEMDFAAAQPL
jgi:hypothetical protein